MRRILKPLLPVFGSLLLGGMQVSAAGWPGTMRPMAPRLPTLHMPWSECGFGEAEEALVECRRASAMCLLSCSA
jgi:hypothetical protein